MENNFVSIFHCIEGIYIWHPVPINKQNCTYYCTLRWWYFVFFSSYLYCNEKKKEKKKKLSSDTKYRSTAMSFAFPCHLPLLIPVVIVIFKLTLKIRRRVFYSCLSASSSVFWSTSSASLSSASTQKQCILIASWLSFTSSSSLLMYLMLKWKYRVATIVTSCFAKHKHTRDDSNRSKSNCDDVEKVFCPFKRMKMNFRKCYRYIFHLKMLVFF